jgi:hypothetical protein
MWHAERGAGASNTDSKFSATFSRNRIVAFMRSIPYSDALCFDTAFSSAVLEVQVPGRGPAHFFRNGIMESLA